MMSARQLLSAAGLAVLLVACVDRITYVDRPVPTPVTGPRTYDTVTVVRPETSFVQLPGRVDTVITQRVDTLIVMKHDTTIVNHYDTVVVVHYDTVRLTRTPASICLYLRSADGDTLYLQRATAINACAPQPMADALPGVKVVVLFDTLKMVLRPPAASRSSLILPTWRATH